MAWYLNTMNFCTYIDTKSTPAKRLAQFKNNKAFQNAFSIFFNEAMTLMPDIEGIDYTFQRIVKESIIWRGGFFGFKMNGRIYYLPGMPSGELTLTGRPVEAYVYGRNGFNQKISLYIPDGDDSITRLKGSGDAESDEMTGVWIRANYDVYPVIEHVIDYAEKVSDTFRTLDTTRFYMKHPGAFFAEKSQIPSVRKFLNDIMNNDIAVGDTGAFDVNKVKLVAFDKNVENARMCTGVIEWYMAEFRQLIGMWVPTTVDKKAQISVDELNSQSDTSRVHLQTTKLAMGPDLEFASEKLGVKLSLPAGFAEEPKQTENNEEEDDNDVAGNSDENIQ